MKKSHIVFVLSCIFIMLFNFTGEASVTPKQIENILINLSDLPSGFQLAGVSTANVPFGAGWLTADHQDTDVPIQGIRQGFFDGKTTWSFKMGLLPTPQQAKEGAQAAILTEDTYYITNFFPGSFSGTSFGNNCFHWDFNSVPSGIKQSISPPFFQKIISFSKERYAVLLSGFSQSQQIEQNLIEQFTAKMEAKVTVAIAKDSFDANLEGLVSHQGILRSLQAKLDVFTKNYQKGKYKTAQNNINAFINELNAQRGKHVSESAYQTLKAYADTIVLSLNALMA